MAKNRQPIGRLPADRELRLALGLPLRNRQELEALLRQIYDPSSPRYHQYLSPTDFAARFGPNAEDYAKLAQYARAANLTVVAAHPNRLILDVSGSVGDIEKAFRVRLQQYQHPKEKRTFFAPDTDPQVPADLQLLHISGLDNFLIPHPAGLTRSPANSGGGKPLSGGGPGGAYRGNDFRGAYARGVSLTGAGQMVGLLEFDGYYLNDITSYESQSSVPNVPIINVLMDGFDGTPVGNTAEVSLDIEMAASMAPGLAAIIVYQASPNGLGNDVLNRMATDNLAKQLSASWTYPVDATTDQILLQFAAQGQTYFNASGDGGAYVGPVDSPADNPNITIVGGTVLSTTGQGGAWTGEVAWNRGTTGTLIAASGGGTSMFFPIPSWQAPVDMSANQGSTTLRNLPDVAAVAEDVWITYGSGSSESVGGTSCSTPLWAGFMALVNQQAAGFGRPPVGFLNPALYALGLGAGYSTNFHDITSGNNTNSDSLTKFYAVPGYDLCTGWGSPFGQNLINALAPRMPFPFLTNVSSTIVSEGCSPPDGAIDPDETVTINFSIKNIGGVKTTNLVATLVADDGVLWPSAPQTYGVLGSGGGAVSRSFTFTAHGTCGANLPATFLLQDGSAQLGKLVFNFPLGKPNVVFTQNFDTVTAPALPSDWTTMASNGVSAWVTSTANRDSSTNAAFADEPPFPGVEDLISPEILITSSMAQLSFRQSFNTEADPVAAAGAYDGGLLEIKIGTNDFNEIIAAGASFVTGGYTCTISTSTNSDSPFSGRPVWGGNSGGFISTVVNLPPTAAGQVVQFRWRFAVDTGNFFGGFGWYIDSVSVRDGGSCCQPSADLQVLTSVAPEPVAPGQALTYSVVVTNLGPGSAYGAIVTNVLASDVMFLSGSAGCTFTNGLVLCNAGTLAAAASASFTFDVLPNGMDSVTNLNELWAFTPDPDLSNNQLLIVSTIASNLPPAVFVRPTNTLAALGSQVLLQASAFGAGPLSYQWFFKDVLLNGETSPSLLLTNLQFEQSGNYSVLVTNLNGSAQSADVQLTVVTAPKINRTDFGANGGTLSVSLTSAIGLEYTLEYKNSLDDPAWTPILPPMSGTGDVISLVDTNLPAVPARFYRVNAH